MNCLDDTTEEEDDIIEELHRIRWAIFEKAGGTPEAYVRYYIKKGEERLAAEKAAKEAEEKRAKRIAKTTAPRSKKSGKRQRSVAVL